MKKTFLLFVTVISMLGARADEGMWIPMLIGKNYDEMQRKGWMLPRLRPPISGGEDEAKRAAAQEES